MHKKMRFTLKVWRQQDAKTKGKFVEYQAKDVLEDMSFLEMLDEVNYDLVRKNEEPIVFEHDCREGICGSCGFMVSGVAHGPITGTTVCQLFMRSFKDGETIVVEPWRARAFPVLRDLSVDRSGLDKVISAGGFVSVNTGGAPDANATRIPKPDVDKAMDAAACIGCGACVAACPNASAMLFVGAKVSQFSLLPQGHPEKDRRAVNMVNKMDEVGFGNCSNHYECEAACPKEISVEHIARMNRSYVRANVCGNQSVK